MGFDRKGADNRIQNEYGPEILSVPALDGEIKYRSDQLEAEDLRSVADELQEQADSLQADE